MCNEDTSYTYIFTYLYFHPQSASQVCKAVKQTFVDPLERPSFDFENPHHHGLNDFWRSTPYSFATTFVMIIFFLSSIMSHSKRKFNHKRNCSLHTAVGYRLFIIQSAFHMCFVCNWTFETFLIIDTANCFLFFKAPNLQAQRTFCISVIIT